MNVYKVTIKGEGPAGTYVSSYEETAPTTKAARRAAKRLLGRKESIVGAEFMRKAT